ncbi:zinc finger protein 845-like [Anopheles nili]|uniref:zinc finger protein 845-like n=1 Tax=Anopheles nili TaxID=185578 RepID=UPI00237AF26D|nr:zinc finger protein 845-like [Anopheles nili]
METLEEDDLSTSCPMESHQKTPEKSVLQRFCRLCMRERPSLLPFHAKLRDISLADMLERILGAFKIKKSTNLPDRVCMSCVTKLDYAYNVQKEFVRNEHRLRHHIQHGALLEKLFVFQTQAIAVKESYAEQILAECGDGLLAEKITVDQAHEVPDMPKAESEAATTFKSMVPPGGWAVMACDCRDKSAASSKRKRTSKTIRSPKRKLRSRQILRQAIAAENPSGKTKALIDPLKCYICDTVTESEDALRDHLVVHSDMLPHTCTICYPEGAESKESNPVTSLVMLQRHYRMHTYPLKCPHCPQRFQLYTSVYAHVRYRHESFDNPEGYTCHVCGITMRYRPSFMYHMRIHYHERMGTFRCQYCDRVFGTRPRLDRHERTHTGERPYACHLCTKTFAHSGQLTTHISRHNNERGHQCEQCGKAFFNKAMLRQHQETHETAESRKSNTKSRQRPCPHPGCTHVAMTYQAYYMHRLRHDMAHRCEECGKRFARQCEVRRHRRIYHSAEHPFKCEACAKTFVSSQSYREHMDSHANVRRYECDICDKKFVRRRNLVNHRMSHTNNRPYQCGDCNTTFKYKSDYNRHRKDKHEQVELDDTLAGTEDETVNEIVLIAEDPIMDGILEESVQRSLLSKEEIELDSSYGEVIETVEESIVAEQPLVTIGIDQVTKEEYIIEYIMEEDISLNKGNTSISLKEQPTTDGTVDDEVTSSDCFCRICLLKHPNLVSLMERIDGVMIPEMLYKLCGRQIEVQEGYPKSICQRCLCLLDCAFKFLNEFHQQDERLRSFYWSGSVLKRLQEYRDEGIQTVETRMENLMARNRNLFLPTSKETSNKTTSTNLAPELIDASTSTELPVVEELVVAHVKTETAQENDLLIDYVIEEDEEASFSDANLSCADAIELPMKEEHLLAMKIDVLEPLELDEDAPFIVEKKERRKVRTRAGPTRTSSRWRAARAKASKVEPEDTAPTESDELSQGQDFKERYENSEHDQEELDESPNAIDHLRCYICDHVEKTEDLLEQHLDLHSVMLPFDCTTCLLEGAVPRTIKTINSLHNHFRSHQFPFRCAQCGKRFLRKVHLQAHEEGHKNELFVCDECGRQFTHRKTWQNHVKRHSAVRTEEYKCKYCNKVFGNNPRLERHIRLHTGERPYGCKYCVKRFYDRHQLQCHTERHFRDLECACDTCGKSFSGVKKLEEHKVQEHLRGAELEEFLAKQTKTARRVSKLKDTHCPFPDCDYVANTYGAMYVHKRTKHQPVHQCDMCHKSFAFLNQLNVHMKLHTGEKPFCCEICGRSFRRGFSYREHMEMHNTDTNFNCPTCNKSFKRPRYLQAHILTHTSVRKFSCEICNNCYKTNGELKKHNRNKHGLEITEEMTETTVDVDDVSVAYVVEYV